MKPSLSRFDSATEDKAALWAARLDGSTLSAESRTELDGWLAENPGHRTLLSQYCQLSADLEQQLPLLAESNLLEDDSIDSATTTKVVRRRPKWARWSAAGVATIAAAAAVTVIVWIKQPKNEFTSVATLVAQRQELTLADGSHIELNAQTALVVDLGRNTRHVRLARGEAFFEVSKDASRPFVVETPAGSVRVTGTKFNVRADVPSTLDVVVVEGSVQVQPLNTNTHSTPPVKLAANDKVSISSPVVSKTVLKPDELAEELAWRQGQIVFHDVSLREALTRFGNYHGRGFSVTPAAADLKIGGRYGLDDLDGFFSGIKEILPIRVVYDRSGAIEVRLENE